MYFRIVVALLALLSLNNMIPMTAGAQPIVAPASSPNPYGLMEKELIPGEGRGAPWMVYANRDGAKVYNENGRDTGQTARFLESFIVMQKRDALLGLCPLGSFKMETGSCDQPLGWMQMDDLILQREAIRNEWNVNQKAFVKVDIDELLAQGKDANTDIFLFRSGPGALGRGPKGYRSLAGDKGVVRIANLFYYVYGVYFENGQYERYLNTDQFGDADYFLLGTKVTASDSELKDVIKGWLPAQSVVFWNSRQALEVRPERKMPAHKFESEPLVINYFKTPGPQRGQYLKSLPPGQAEIDDGESRPTEGQSLRYLLIRPKHHENLQLDLAYVGFTGNLSKGGAADPTGQAAQIQEGARYIDVFFLVDATQSMGPVLSAAAETVQAIQKTLPAASKDLKVNVQAAVYRDDADGPQSYDLWDGKSNLSAWLKKVPATSSKHDDYEEAVYEAIDRAMADWHFSHKYSIRILFILGDAGDNHRCKTLRSEADVSRLFSEKLILPFPIHFNHALGKNDPGGLGAKCQAADVKGAPPKYLYSKERLAMCAFLDQMNKIRQNMTKMAGKNKKSGLMNNNYGDLAVKSLPAQNLSQELKRVLKELGQEVPKFISYMMDRRQGFKVSSGDGNSDVGSLLRLRLDLLAEKSKGLSDLLEGNTELAFIKAWMPTQYKDEGIMRPVLLLSDAELQTLEENIRFYSMVGRVNCNLELLDKMRNKASLAVLGDLMYMAPEAVTRESLAQWQDHVIDRDRESYINAAGDILEKICFDVNQKAWERFINKMDTLQDTIAAVKNDEARTYLDIHTNRYYWVYPDELFPLPDVER